MDEIKACTTTTTSTMLGPIDWLNMFLELSEKSLAISATLVRLMYTTSLLSLSGRLLTNKDSLLLLFVLKIIDRVSYIYETISSNVLSTAIIWLIAAPEIASRNICVTPSYKKLHLPHHDSCNWI